MTQGHHYATLDATLLGDDLYGCQPICEHAVSAGFHFIFTCKEDSHKCLYERVNSLEHTQGVLHVTQEVKEKNRRYTYRCRYVNPVPLREGKGAMQVNGCGVEVFDHRKEKVIYRGAFVTDHLIDATHVVALIQAGRTRWKIENEHNNTLKNQGYHLAHNFGHGKQHLASFLATLIMLSFLFHTLLRLLDARYQALRGVLPRYQFFQHLRTLLFYMYFATWSALMACMLQGCELEGIDSS